MRAALPRFWELEQRHGSLLRGMLAGGRRRAGGRGKRAIFSCREGLVAWPHALARELGAERLWLNAPLTGLRRGAGGWEAWIARGGARGGGAVQVWAGKVVLAVPAYVAAELLEEGGSGALGGSALREMPYAPMAVVHLGYRREQVAHPLDGFGLLCPAREGRDVLGSLWPASLFAGRAPEGCVLTTNFVGGARHPERAAWNDGELIERTQAELRSLLGARGEPLLARVVRWPRAIPQYIAGHNTRLRRLAQAEAGAPGLHLLANYRSGIGVEACWQNGVALARQLAMQH
jgi:oxygen-dependent protoporphyrinogen oxidase